MSDNIVMSCVGVVMSRVGDVMSCVGVVMSDSNVYAWDGQGDSRITNCNRGRAAAQALGTMSLHAVARPYYHPGRVPPRSQWAARDESSAPPASLQHVLAVNDLAGDEATSRDGNCGISAFTISLLSQLKGDRHRATSAEARKRQSLRRCPQGQRVTQARAAAVEWLGQHQRAKLWEGMIVAGLVRAVTGEDFPTYLQKMRRNGEWADTVFMHALACAYGVTVLVFQDSIEPAILGPHLHDDLEHECAVVVPVALVNDYHFWAAVQSTLPGLGSTPWATDKGEHAPFQAKGVHPGPTASTGTAPTRSQGRPSCAEEDDCDHACDPTSAPQPNAARSPSEIDAELHLCVALSRWCPWSSPTEETVQAIQGVAQQQSRAADLPARCLVRRRAMEALAYEAAHAHTLPENMRYQRGARRHLLNPREWHRGVKAREHTRKYMNACVRVLGVDALEAQMEHFDCSRARERDHSVGCAGVHQFSAAVIHNWRVLWHSMPSTNRRELLVRSFVEHLEAHQAIGGADEQWRMQYKFLGKPVCKIAFLQLTGMNNWMLQQARDGALQGRRSVLSTCEMGLHAAIKNQSKAHLYLSARQWLEHYAATHAELSPMDDKAYLPSGRKTFYYFHYRRDMLERHRLLGAASAQASQGGDVILGSTPRSGSPDAASAQASQGVDAMLGSTPRRRRLAGDQLPETPVKGKKRSHQDGPGQGSGPSDPPCASLCVFLDAWRAECPWIVVAKSLSMFTRCSVCDYLKLMIEQTPREQNALRECLKDRLGQHFDFQAAQRLAHGRVEEHASQSGGTHWCTLIDKMDQRKTVVPTVWSQLATPLFKDVDKRLVTGLIGSMWFGTAQTTHHIRTVMDDCQHGSEMQCSTLLLNLHRVAMAEGHLPRQWSICADNTRKETKNQIAMWFIVWLLCALHDTPLWTIDVLFLLVGHTHNKLDRFFSRIAVALAGRDYITVTGMLRQMREHLTYCDVKSDHLSQVWGWKGLLEHQCTASMRNLDPVHAFRFSRSDGIYVQWKQWCTDEAWGKPIRLVSQADMPVLAAFRPHALDMAFPSAGQQILDWVDRFEFWCASQPAGTYSELQHEFAWLRGIVHHTVPGEYAPGTRVDNLLADLRGLPAERAPGPTPQSALPMDAITQLFPGADIPAIPTAALLKIDGITHTKKDEAIRSNIIRPGSFLLIRVPQGTVVHALPVSFLIGVAVETGSSAIRERRVVVVWYVPGLAPAETFRSGGKKKILDLFGPWATMDDMTVAQMRSCHIPAPIVHVHDVMECNFELTSEETLPYDVFDALRRRHGIDVTGLSTSMTHRGNLYRSYALLGGRV